MTLATSASVLSSALLDSYLGQNISAICPHGYDDADLNHCAHFVCHVMNTAAGTVSCRGMSARAVRDRIGVCIRVHQLFAACPTVGEYDAATPDQLAAGVFVFVTAKSGVNLATKTMVNVPRKHVGIGLGGTIWHYSNTRDAVATATPAQFILHYRGQSNGLYFGSFPAQSSPSSFGLGR